MDCPVCKEAMMVIEYEKIELDYCDSCRGVWLDEGELDLLFGNHQITHGFLTSGNPAKAQGETSRLCPICDTVMKKAVTGGSESVVYDHCPEEHGLWFDHGELLSVLQQGILAGEEAVVVQWLREIFPKSPISKQEQESPPS